MRRFLPLEIVRSAVALRRWVLCGTFRNTPPPPAQSIAWEVFLRTERCAAWLLQEAAGLAHDTVERRALVEWQRILSARAQLQRVGRWAATEGRRVAVLKGGLSVLGGSPTDLLDADVVASGPDARALAAHLEREGFGIAQPDAAARLAVRVEADAVQIEIHTAVPGITVSPGEPLSLVASGWPGLDALVPADHLFHLLHHSAVQHPERRGRIRELIVIGHAIGQSGREDLDLVRERLRGDRWRSVLEMQLDMAQSLREVHPVSDGFELEAACNYAVAEWTLRTRPSAGLGRWLARGVSARAARRRGAESDVGGTTLQFPSGNPVLRALRHVLPPAERAVRILVRRLPEWSAAPLAGRLVERAAAACADPG